MAIFQIAINFFIGWFLLSIPAGLAIAYFFSLQKEAQTVESKIVSFKQRDDYPAFRRIN